jgi:hypothetical protein
MITKVNKLNSVQIKNRRLSMSAMRLPFLMSMVAILKSCASPNKELNNNIKHKVENKDLNIKDHQNYLRSPNDVLIVTNAKNQKLSKGVKLESNKLNLKVENSKKTSVQENLIIPLNTKHKVENKNPDINQQIVENQITQPLGGEKSSAQLGALLNNQKFSTGVEFESKKLNLKVENSKKTSSEINKTQQSSDEKKIRQDFRQDLIAQKNDNLQKDSTQSKFNTEIIKAIDAFDRAITLNDPKGLTEVLEALEALDQYDKASLDVHSKNFLAKIKIDINNIRLRQNVEHNPVDNSQLALNTEDLAKNKVETEKLQASVGEIKIIDQHILQENNQLFGNKKSGIKMDFQCLSDKNQHFYPQNNGDQSGENKTTSILKKLGQDKKLNKEPVNNIISNNVSCHPKSQIIDSSGLNSVLNQYDKDKGSPYKTKPSTQKKNLKNNQQQDQSFQPIIANESGEKDIQYSVLYTSGGDNTKSFAELQKIISHNNQQTPKSVDTKIIPQQEIKRNKEPIKIKATIKETLASKYRLSIQNFQNELSAENIANSNLNNAIKNMKVLIEKTEKQINDSTYNFFRIGKPKKITDEELSNLKAQLQSEQQELASKEEALKVSNQQLITVKQNINAEEKNLAKIDNMSEQKCASFILQEEIKKNIEEMKSYYKESIAAETNIKENLLNQYRWFIENFQKELSTENIANSNLKEEIKTADNSIKLIQKQIEGQNPGWFGPIKVAKITDEELSNLKAQLQSGKQTLGSKEEALKVSNQKLITAQNNIEKYLSNLAIAKKNSEKECADFILKWIVEDLAKFAQGFNQAIERKDETAINSLFESIYFRDQGLEGNIANDLLSKWDNLIVKMKAAGIKYLHTEYGASGGDSSGQLHTLENQHQQSFVPENPEEEQKYDNNIMGSNKLHNDNSFGG